MRHAATSEIRNAACLLALLMLAGCSNGGVNTPAASDTAPDRGASVAPATMPTADPVDAASAKGSDIASYSAATHLPGLAGRNVRSSGAGRYQAVPSSVAEFLLSLPARDVLIPRQILQQVLQAKAFVVEIPHAHGNPNLRVTMTNDPGHGYWLWVRSFHGASKDVTHYLVQLSLRCNVSTDATADEQARLVHGACAQPGRPAIDTGLLAYRVVAGGAPENVTASIADPASVLGAETFQRYQEMGGSDLFVDDSRLDQVPVFRWVIEFDPEQPLPDSDPRAFDHGSDAHAGFVAFTGDGFASSDTVPASLWPCPEGKPAQCPSDDRFVIDTR